MSAWLDALPAVAVLLVAWLGPGLLTGRLLGLRGIVLLGAAPALSMTVLAGGAVLAPWLRLRWSVGTAIGMTVAFAVLAWLFGRLAAHHSPAPLHRLTAPTPAQVRFALLVALALALLIGVPAVLAVHTPTEVIDSHDVVFHLNRLRTVLDSGNGSSLAYDYPSAFHDLGALPVLAVGAPLEAVVNLVSLAAAIVVFPLGLVSLATVVFRGDRSALVGSAAAAATLTAFPTNLMGWGVLWPNVIGQAALPGVVALGVVAVRTAAAARRPARGWLLSPAALAVVAALPGLTLAHPNALVDLVLIAVAGVVTVLVTRAVTGPHRLRYAIAVVATLAAPLAAAALLPHLSARVAATVDFRWQISSGVPGALGEILGSSVFFTPLWGVVLFQVIGLVTLVRARRAWWVVTTYLATVTLYVVAATTNGPLSTVLTGLWYSDRLRLAALVTLPLSLVVGAGFGTVCGWWPPAPSALRRRGRRDDAPSDRAATGAPAARSRSMVPLVLTTLLFAVGSMGMTADGRYQLLRSYYYPSDPTHTILTAQDQVDLLSLAALVPKGQIILGDPSNGSALLYALTDRPVLWTAIGATGNADANLLGRSLRYASTDPAVCPALARVGSQYVLDAAYDYWGNTPATTSGLVRLAGVPGFQKVATAGKYTLYRITACSPDGGG